jgi:hypothetical protein
MKKSLRQYNMKRIVTFSIVTISFIFISTILMCYTSLNADRILTIADVAFSALSVSLIVWSIKSSNNALKVTILQNVYNDFLIRIKEYNDELDKLYLFTDLDDDSRERLNIRSNPLYSKAGYCIPSFCRAIETNIAPFSDTFYQNDSSNGIESYYLDEAYTLVWDIDRISDDFFGYVSFFSSLSELCEEIHCSEMDSQQKRVLIRQIHTITIPFLKLFDRYVGSIYEDKINYRANMPYTLMVIENPVNQKNHLQNVDPIIDFDLNSYKKLESAFDTYLSEHKTT